MPLEKVYRLCLGKYRMDILQLSKKISGEESKYNFFLLIDAAKNYTYMRHWLTLNYDRNIKYIGNLFDGTVDDSTPLEFSPLLLNLNKLNNQKFINELVIEENLGMFSILKTNLSNQELIKHFQPFLQAELPAGELALFRFYDPSVIKSLNRLLDKKNLDILLEPIDGWWYQEVSGDFKLLERI